MASRVAGPFDTAEEAFAAAGTVEAEFPILRARTEIWWACPSPEFAAVPLCTHPSRLFSMARILIVDDELDSGKTFTAILNKAGHVASHVTNGKEALIEVISSPPDVVLLDLMMPEMDGPSFLEVVRSYLRLQSLPVVVLTALGDSPLVDRVQHLKVNAVLIKGKASPDAIVKALEEAVGRAPG